MRISDWSSDVCSSDLNASTTLAGFPGERFAGRVIAILPTTQADSRTLTVRIELPNRDGRLRPGMFASVALGGDAKPALLVPSEAVIRTGRRSEEHTSELQSLMRLSYAVLCLTKKNKREIELKL